MAALFSCSRSVSVASDGPKAERGKVEEEEEEKAAAAPEEEPATSAPPAVREVPAHLRKPEVRSPWKICFLLEIPIFFPEIFSLQIPPEFDIDSENPDDCYLCPEYAKEIFDYLKQREVSRGQRRFATFLSL